MFHALFRRASRPGLCRWVLGGLLLSWGLACAAPLLRPAVLTLVCSGAGMSRLVDLSRGEPVEAGHAAIPDLPDCAQCLAATVAAPPPAPQGSSFGGPDRPLAQRPAVPAPFLFAAPMPPARGPPDSV